MGRVSEGAVARRRVFTATQLEIPEGAVKGRIVWDYAIGIGGAFGICVRRKPSTSAPLPQY